MDCISILNLLLLLLLSSDGLILQKSSTAKHAFRSDYTHIATTDSSYKYHQEIVNWHDAVSKCKSEDTELFYPKNEYELMQVKSVLQVENSLWIGISDLRETNVYETVDGRPLSQVYNKWYHGQPDRNGEHCLLIYIIDYTLRDTRCLSDHYSYICRTKYTSPTQNALEGVKMISADVSDKIVVALERQTVATQQLAANQTTVLERLIETMQQQAANQVTASETQREASENQTTVLERLIETMQQQAANQVTASETQREASENQTTVLERLIETMQQQAANQVTANETEREASENQTTVMERLTEGMLRLAENQAAALERQAETNQHQAANQTAVMGRLALALEKLAEDNQQLDVRTQQ